VDDRDLPQLLFGLRELSRAGLNWNVDLVKKLLGMQVSGPISTGQGEDVQIAAGQTAGGGFGLGFGSLEAGKSGAFTDAILPVSDGVGVAPLGWGALDLNGDRAAFDHDWELGPSHGENLSGNCQENKKIANFIGKTWCPRQDLNLYPVKD
jgi:hypothetical protein